MRHISDSILGIGHFRWAGLCWSGSFEPLRNPIHSSRITSVDLVCCDHVTYDTNYTDICCIGHGLYCWQVLWSPPWCQRCRLHAFPSPRAIWFHGRCTMWAMPIWFTICGAFLATTDAEGGLLWCTQFDGWDADDMWLNFSLFAHQTLHGMDLFALAVKRVQLFSSTRVGGRTSVKGNLLQYGRVGIWWWSTQLRTHRSRSIWPIQVTIDLTNKSDY